MIFRRRFGDVVSRQLDIFAEEYGGLILECEEAEEAYDKAPRDEAEERYGDFLDLVETGTDELVELRENYASSLDPDTAEGYRAVFNEHVRRSLPRFGLEVE